MITINDIISNCFEMQLPISTMGIGILPAMKKINNILFIPEKKKTCLLMKKFYLIAMNLQKAMNILRWLASI